MLRLTEQYKLYDLSRRLAKTNTLNVEVSSTTQVLRLCEAVKVELIAYLVHQAEAISKELNLMIDCFGLQNNISYMTYLAASQRRILCDFGESFTHRSLRHCEAVKVEQISYLVHQAEAI